MTKPELSKTQWKYIEKILTNYESNYHTATRIIDEAVKDIVERFAVGINLDEGESWLCDNAGTAYEAIAWQFEEAE